jgi:dihydrofolate reductase
MEIALIVAVARNQVIGVDGGLPWRIPADMKWFRARTLGHHVVMGRKTWASIGRPLAGRTNLVVSRNPELVTPGAQVVSSLDLAIAIAERAGEDELFVIGGQALYRESLPRADRVYLTEVDASPDGDAFFPELDRGQWRERSREAHAGADGPAFCFVVLERSRADQRAP